jgi:hypothetical protein
MTTTMAEQATDLPLNERELQVALRCKKGDALHAIRAVAWRFAPGSAA